MPNIDHVNASEMWNTAVRLAGCVLDWDASVKKMNTVVQELNAMWDGTANEAFMRRWEEDMRKYEELSKLIYDYYLAVEDAAVLYMEGEKEVTRIIKSGNSGSGYSRVSDCMIPGIDLRLK